MRDPTPNGPTGSRMSYWMAWALKDARVRAGIGSAKMATSLDVNERTIKRLEEGKSLAGHKLDMESAVAGYAYVLGIEDGRELWRRAIDEWMKHGSPPVHVSDPGPASAFAEEVRLAVLRQSPSEGTSATARKRRATR